MSGDNISFGGLRWLLLACAAAFLSGCVNVHRVTVDSLVRPGTKTASYSIQAANPVVAKSSARDEAMELVKTALSGRGLYEAPPTVTPDVVIELDYGLGPPQHRYVKVYTGNFPLHGANIDGPPRWEGIVASETVETRTTYEKYLRLKARESTPSTPGRPAAEIWTVDVICVGKSDDIGKYLPILAAASIDYIGRDSHGHKTVRIKDSDADVIFVKKGMPRVAER